MGWVILTGGRREAISCGRHTFCMGRDRWALGLDLAVKAALVGLLLFALARPDLPQFHGKAMLARALTYPLAALIVPAWWWLRGRRSGTT